jgi:hypothetical protein
VKRSGTDETIWVVIYMCMVSTLGISLYSYLYLKLVKTPCFSYICYVSSSTKWENKKAQQALPGSGSGGERSNNV